MKDPEQALRTAYNAALTGKIFINESLIPVYVAAVPSIEKPPYICISEVTITSAPSVADCVSYDCTVLIDIVAAYDNDKIKPSVASSLGATVMHLSEEIETPLDGVWEVHSHGLDMSQSLLEESETKTITRRLIRFRNRLYYIGI